MKLVIQIPAYNEQDTILEVLRSIPKKIKGVDEIKIFVIDDGSYDKTYEIVKKFNPDKIIKFNKNKGLSFAFMAGLKIALENNADIMVNIDGDNQYCAYDIEKLIQPILNNNADIVIGTRPINKIKTFSITKKILQKLGSYVVKIISGIDIKDAPSGFRAYSKNAMLNMNIFNSFSYTVESLIQAKNKNLTVENVDINVNLQINRKSKLFKSNFDYILKQSKTLIRYFIIYRPARFFNIFATILLLIGLLIGGRFLYYFLNYSGTGHIQSLILCAIVMILSFICYMAAIIGDLFSINRKLLEDVQFELRSKKYKK